MAYAVTLRLDTEAASRVAAMWRELADQGVSDAMVRLGYPPHLTLAVLPDEAARDRLLTAARQTAGKWRAPPIALASLGVFPGTPAVLFLAPVATARLLAMHEELLTTLAGEAIDPHYQSGHWVPHVTLASDVADPAAAVATLAPWRLPITAVPDAIEVVRFRPVQVLASHRLQTG